MQKAKYLILVSLFFPVIILDQWTKYAIHTGFRWGESRPIWENFFALTYVRNSGAAFGILHRAPAWFRDPFFLVVSLVALVVIVFLFIRLTMSQKSIIVALSLILGGAVGNLIDRLRFGFVIDFLDFHWKEVYHWPSFNVADSCIVVGVGLLFLNSLRQGKEEARPPSSVV